MENFNLNETSIFHLTLIRKWTKFISVVMFVMIGFMILAGIMMSLIMKTLTAESLGTPMPFSPAIMAVFYVLMAVIYFFPVYYLFKFSENLGHALQSGSSDALATALGFLKNHYNYVGILLIIGLVFMALAFLFAIFGAIIGLGATSGGKFL